MSILPVFGRRLFSYPASDWGYFFLLAVIPTLLGHSLFNWVLKWLSTNMISVAILFEPVGAVALAYWVLDESVMMTQVIGGAVIFQASSCSWPRKACGKTPSRP
ncbi:DMT family transporter [Bacillus licheniformis]